MKKLKYILAAAVMAGGMWSCSLDEHNYSTVDTEIAYNSIEGYYGIINACYENIYYMYGKLDGIGPMEMGTDLWKVGSLAASNGGITNYNSDLTTETGVLKTIWNALYCTVGYCNTALYYQNRSTEFTPAEVEAKAAEARFLRAFCWFHLVEQWGGVVLDTISFSQAGAASERAYRSTETEFYDKMINDLKLAYANLPVSQGKERGRATKKAALGMLAKAYMQRTRLYDEGSTEYKAYADSAFQAAKELIDNASSLGCGLYASTTTASGDAQAWDGDNNKDNDEFLFVEAVDADNGYNPEGWNRGRTCQYYMISVGSQASNFGISGEGLRYGRANATSWSPTYYLLHECFDPKLPVSETEDELIDLAIDQENRTPDTRFENAFYYKYYAMSQTTLTKATLANYKKDTENYFSKASERRIASGYMTGSALESSYPGMNYYAGSTNSGENFEVETIPDALGVYAPNWELDTLKTAANKRLCVGIDNQFNMTESSFGQQAEYTYFRNVFPSFKKYRNFKYVYTNQYCMMDIPILRLTDIYLIAAEAAIAKGTPAEGLEYLNAVRRHAALSTYASEMEVTVNEMTVDYLLKERARELCGEQWRWYDLKRTGRLTNEYLTQKGMNPYIYGFNDAKHIIRPVPQSFLDAIANADEFGNNGY